MPVRMGAPFPHEGIATMPGQAPFHANEHDLFLGYLAQQRSVLRLTAYGLTDEQARDPGALRRAR